MTPAELPASIDGWRDSKAYAEENQWPLLATGDWSWVYNVPNTEIVWRITPFDPAFEVFVKTCLSSPANPHLPDIHGNHTHRMGGATTVMERLDEVERELAESWFADLDRGGTPALEQLRQGISAPELGSDVSLFVGIDRNPANVLRRPSDGELVFTDAFWINGPLLLELVRTAPEKALENYPRSKLAEWAHLPCMDEATTTLILRAIDSVA